MPKSNIIKQKTTSKKVDEQEILVRDVLEDFEERRQNRLHIEQQFVLNMNFVVGNQYSFINNKGEIEDESKTFSWESREVYNHLAQILETRLSKLARVRPSMSVRPSSGEDSDIWSAKLASNILSSVATSHKLSELVASCTLWSEVCGTSFYKIVWNSESGMVVGEDANGKIFEGDVDISVCPPFEIFPDNPNAKSLDECNSIIHARAYPVNYVQEKYGIQTQGEDIDVFTFGNVDSGAVCGAGGTTKVIKTKMPNHAVVIERYEKPTTAFPNGRLVIVCGKTLLFDGELPYVTLENEKRGFPFVRQLCNESVGNFWGGSVIERCIPVQKAYNAIKNRKHEFLTRLAVGVLAVEDGSVDVDNLEEEGLAPGKILVYRNGSTIPRFMDEGSIPSEFSNEEDRLLNEFIALSGVSELMRNSTVPSSVSSGTALNLLIEQDDTRLSLTAENIRYAIKEIGSKILRLFKQFAHAKRLAKVTNDNGDVELYYFNKSQLTCDDVVLDTTNELTETPSSRKMMVQELLKLGLFTDENGKMNNRTKAKVLDALGFGSFETATDMTGVHMKRASKENLSICELQVLEIDDHEIHIAEHKKYLLNEHEKMGKDKRRNLLEHIQIHQNMQMQDGLKSQILK